MLSSSSFISVVVGAALVSGALSAVRQCSSHHPVEVLSTTAMKIGMTLVQLGECGHTVRFSDFQQAPQVNIIGIDQNKTYTLVLFKENSTGRPYTLWKLENIKPYREGSTFDLTHRTKSYNVSVGFTPLMNVTANYTILIISENGTSLKESEVTHPDVIHASSGIQEFIHSNSVVGISTFRTEAKQPSIHPYPHQGPEYPDHRPPVHPHTANTMRPPVPEQANHQTHPHPTQVPPQVNMNHPGHPAYTPSPQDIYSTIPGNLPKNPPNAHPFVPPHTRNDTHPLNATTHNHNHILNNTNTHAHVHQGKSSKGSAGQHQASISIMTFALLFLAKTFM